MTYSGKIIHGIGYTNATLTPRDLKRIFHEKDEAAVIDIIKASGVKYQTNSLGGVSLKKDEAVKCAVWLEKREAAALVESAKKYNKIRGKAAENFGARYKAELDNGMEAARRYEKLNGLLS